MPPHLSLHHLVFSFAFFFWSIFSGKIPFFSSFFQCLFFKKHLFVKECSNTTSCCVFFFWNHLFVLSVVQVSSLDSQFFWLIFHKDKQISVLHFWSKIKYFTVLLHFFFRKIPSHKNIFYFFSSLPVKRSTFAHKHDFLFVLSPFV